MDLSGIFIVTVPTKSVKILRHLGEIVIIISVFTKSAYEKCMVCILSLGGMGLTYYLPLNTSSSKILFPYVSTKSPLFRYTSRTTL